MRWLRSLNPWGPISWDPNLLTLQETNASAPEKNGYPKRKLIFKPSMNSGANCHSSVSFSRVYHLRNSPRGKTQEFQFLDSLSFEKTKHLAIEVEAFEKKHSQTNGPINFGVSSLSFLRLVGGFNPFEKYARQIGSFPQGSG